MAEGIGVSAKHTRGKLQRSSQRMAGSHITRNTTCSTPSAPKGSPCLLSDSPSGTMAWALQQQQGRAQLLLKRPQQVSQGLSNHVPPIFSTEILKFSAQQSCKLMQDSLSGPDQYKALGMILFIHALLCLATMVMRFDIACRFQLIHDSQDHSV